MLVLRILVGASLVLPAIAWGQRIDELGGTRYSMSLQERDQNGRNCSWTYATRQVLEIHRAGDPAASTMAGTLQIATQYTVFSPDRRKYCEDSLLSHVSTYVLEFDLDERTFKSTTTTSTLTGKVGERDSGSYDVLNDGRTFILDWGGASKYVFQADGAPVRSSPQLTSPAQRKRRLELERARQQEEAQEASKAREEAVKRALDEPPDLVLSCRVVSIRGAQISTSQTTSGNSSSTSSAAFSNSLSEAQSNSGASFSAQRSQQAARSTLDSCAGQQGWQNLRLVMSVWTKISYCNAEPCGISPTAINAREISVNRYTGQGSTECYVWQCEREEDPLKARKF